MHPNIPIEENWNRELDAVRDTHIANDRAWSCDRQCCLHRLVRPDAFQRSIDPNAIRHVFHCFNRHFTTFLDDIRRTKLASKLLTSRMSAQRQNACRA